MRTDRTRPRRGRVRRVGTTMLVGALLAGCGAERAGQTVPDPERRSDATITRSAPTAPDPDPTVVPSSQLSGPTSNALTTTAPSPTSTPDGITSTTTTTTTSPATSTTSSTSTTTSTATTTSTTPPGPHDGGLDTTWSSSNAAFESFARSNAAASLTLVRGGEIVASRASGMTIGGAAATSDSPMVVASVSKVVVALGIARLAEQGRVDIDAPVPWADLGFAPHPGWADVTVRELLDHRSGMAKARSSWFTGAGDCRSHVSTLLAPPPNGDRGRWVYSNGNYCILGLLVEQRSELPLDVALQILVFDPIDAEGIHLIDGGLRSADVAHAEGVERLSRLGGAGTLMVSTDDLAMMLARTTDADRSVLLPPGVFTDQYGWGHTGTVSGAKSCVWVLEGGSTVVAATIAGNSVSTGGEVCDRVVPAVATDLGLVTGLPNRTP